VLSGKNVCRSFGGLKALDGVDFELNKGEILGLIGPNGSGKTTLFNVISGIYRPDRGEVMFKGQRISGLPPHKIAKLGIGRTFQIVKPFEYATVSQNVVVASLYGRAEARSLIEAEKEAFKWLEFTGLIEKKGILVRNLTIAQRRSLEVARALALIPDVMLLDEVMAGLNPVEVDNASRMIRRIRDELNISVFLVEHVMRAVMGLSDRIIVLNQGRKIAEGNASAIANNRAVVEAYLGEPYA